MSSPSLAKAAQTHYPPVTLADSLSGMAIIARLTLTEAMRRRFYVAGIVVSLFYVGIAFLPLHINPQRRELLGDQFVPFVAAMYGTYGAYMIEFFCFLFAVALSAGAISAEIERGTLAVIIPKPLPRWAIYVGKWIGVNLFLAPLLIWLTALLQWDIWMHIHQTAPSIWTAMPVMYLYPLVFSMLTLCFSSFAGNLLATILPLIMASAAWSEGTLRLIGYAFDINSLKLASKTVVYIVPLNPMSRWLDRAENFTILQQLPWNHIHPWPNDPPANMIDLAWILGYALAFFVVGMVIFQKRDL